MIVRDEFMHGAQGLLFPSRSALMTCCLRWTAIRASPGSCPRMTWHSIALPAGLIPRQGINPNADAASTRPFKSSVAASCWPAARAELFTKYAAANVAP